MRNAFLSSCLLISLCGLSQAASLESHIPTTRVERFVSDNLDLSTFRNSTAQSRTPTKRTFSSLGMKPTLAENGKLQFDSPEWFYGIEIKDRQDYNGDGIEDLALCFTDKSKKGSYSTQDSLLVTRYSETGFLIALGFEADACEADKPAYAVPKLEFGGMGPVKIGMTVAQISKQLGAPLDPQNPDENGCRTFAAPTWPGVTFLTINEKLARIEVHGRGIVTDSGVQVGDTEQKIKDLYGRSLQVEPHKYVDAGHYMKVKSKDGKTGFTFETDGNVVTEFRAGQYPQVDWVEGCY